jgi:tetratricopeptide (TPR) repeat protein
LGRHEGALGHLVPATRLDPASFSAWFLRGCAELALNQHALAAASFGACISLRPDFAPAWLNRGLAYRGMAFAGLRFTKLARGDFDRAIELDPKLTDAFIERALLRIEQHDLAGAEEDYDRALATGTAPVRVYFLRYSVRTRRGDAAGAKADREAGLRLTPTDEMSWIARAENRLADDPRAALADDEEALKLNPTSIFGLQLKAHILAEHLNRPAEAMAALDRAVELNPDFVPARAGRGVMLAREGKRDAAIRDAKDALRRDASATNLYQVGCIYALTAKTHPQDKPEAIRLLWGGLKRGYGLDIVDTDTDLDPIRNDPDFQQMVKDARALNARRD